MALSTHAREAHLNMSEAGRPSLVDAVAASKKGNAEDHCSSALKAIPCCCRSVLLRCPSGIPDPSLRTRTVTRLIYILILEREIIFICESMEQGLESDENLYV